MMSLSINSYNSELDNEQRQAVSDLVERGKGHLRRSAEEVIEFGKVLLELKELLPHGAFLRCVEDEFEISEATAQNQMNAARRFSDKPLIIRDLSPTVLYLLSSPGTPYEVLDEVFLRVSSGEKIKADDVRKMIRRSKTKILDEVDFFDDLIESEKRELDALEGTVRAKLERLIIQAEKVEAEMRAYFLKINSKEQFSDRVQEIFKARSVGSNARRVLATLMDPESWRECFGLETAKS